MLVFRFDAPTDEGVTALEGISGPGDGGGPALIETVDGLRLAGLSVAQDSSGHGRGTYGVWEFYTRVSAEANWVRDTIQPADQTGMSETPSSPPVGESPGARAVGSLDETPAPALGAEDRDGGSSPATSRRRRGSGIYRRSGRDGVGMVVQRSPETVRADLRRPS